MIDLLPVFSLQGISPQSEVLEVRYMLSRAADASLLVALDAAVKIVDAAGAVGAFPNFQGNHAKSRLHLIRPAEKRLDAIVQRLSCRCLDVRALCHIGQMAVRLRANGLHFDRMEVIDVSAPDGPRSLLLWPHEDDEERAYPCTSDVLRSLLYFEDVDYAKSRRFLVAIDRSLSTEEILSFDAWIEPWKKMLERSAFALPVGLPDKTECLFGAVSQFDDNTIEVHVNVFCASDQAWVTLGHMTISYWLTRARIVHLIVD